LFGEERRERGERRENREEREQRREKSEEKPESTKTATNPLCLLHSCHLLVERREEEET